MNKELSSAVRRLLWLLKIGWTYVHFYPAGMHCYAHEWRCTKTGETRTVFEFE